MNNENLSEQVQQHVMTVTDEEFAELSVSILANLFNIDRFKLSRQFKRQTSITLEDFLCKEKMTRAAFLLSYYRDIKVKEVSKRIGYCNCDYFIRKFRQYYGIVPGKYKKYKTKNNRIEERKSGSKN